MAKLAFYTQTYCSEKYVRRTIESILNQTFQDFVYYISDDGSTDATPEIIMEYANKDARIIPFFSKTNNIVKLYTESVYRIWERSGAEYFSILDHDDEYAPDYAEKMIFAMEQQDVDIAVCGTSLTDLETGKLLEVRTVGQNVLINRKSQGRLFPQLFQFYRTVWGKIYKINFLIKNEIKFRVIVNYGRDTLFCLDCFSAVEQFIVLGEALHTYYINADSMSYHFDPKRADDDLMLYKEGICYLEKIQGITLDNTRFLLNVYFYAVMDNINLICKSKLRVKQIINNLYNIFKNDKFLEILENFRYICKAEYVIESITIQTKIKFEQQVFLVLKNLILINAEYKKEIFDIAFIFCPELNDFFDENNIKAFLSQDMICNAFFSRDFGKAYQLIDQLCDSDCLASNRILYNLKVYLAAILHIENGIVQAYIKDNRRKTDGLTAKRISFLSEYGEMETKQSDMGETVELKISEDAIQNFDELMDFVRSHSEIEILKYGFKNYLDQNKISKAERVKKRPFLYQHFLENCFVGLFKSQFVGGGLLSDTIGDIKTHVEDYVWLYQILEDEESRTTLFYVLMYRIFLNKKYLSLSSTKEIQYFSPNIIPKDKAHVFVDCGAFHGDSATDFIKYCTDNENYKRIYCYESAPDNYTQVVETMSHYHDIVCRNKGVFDVHTQMHFTSNMPSAGKRINPMDDKLVETVDIDSDIKEPVTFIKMDIESAEPNALLGAQRHIIEDKPILAICVYHTVTDLLKIPQIIYGMNQNQKFYLRHHDQNTPEEIVFYALPVKDPLEEGNTDFGILLQQIEQLAELYDTIGESILYIRDKLAQGDKMEAFQMIPLLQEGLEQELSVVRSLTLFGVDKNA